MIFELVVWLLILPLAILATPFIHLSKTLGIKNSGIEGLIDFYLIPRSWFVKEVK